MYLLKPVSVLILIALIGVTAYFDKKGEVTYCSISFITLIIYTIITAYVLTRW